MSISEQKVIDNFLVPETVMLPAELVGLVKDFAHDAFVQGQNSHVQSDERTQRHTIQYGYNYFDLEAGGREYIEPPEFLVDVGHSILAAFSHDKPAFSNYILSFYQPGYHLEPHVDAGQSKGAIKSQDFYFEEGVYGLVLEADPTGQLYFVHYEGEGVPPLDLPLVYSLPEQSGLAYLLNGKARYVPYWHGVSEVTRRRISITFRHAVLT